MDSPEALRARLFGARVRVTLANAAAHYADALRGAGVTDVRVEGHVISIGLSSDAPRQAPVIVRRLVEAGADIEAVEPEEPSLEEIYLSLLKGDRP